MKLRSQAIFSLIVLIFFALFVYEAREWRLQARLYPWVIGIPMLVLALVQVFLDLKGETKSKPADGAPVDFQFGQSMDSSVARRRTLNIFSWIIGFLIGVWLLGFSVAIPAMVFLYLKLQSNEKWLLSLVLTGAAWFLFWGLFDWLLRLPFPEAQLFVWLGLT
ncbi:hypothetical protein EPO44_14385 [bacterium]|nr:MAG: hypothetical protein EPO44_14385 [bacterium]